MNHADSQAKTQLARKEDKLEAHQDHAAGHD